MSEIVREQVKLLVEGGAPSAPQIESAMNEILSGNVDPVLISAFLTGLRMKGESVDDITAAAGVMRRHARRVEAPERAVDTCGTGGLPFTTLNTSTASAIVAAATGAKITKHGNRSVPPKTGSADVLEALGVNLATSDAQYNACIAEAGVAFMFAQTHHSAMRHVAPVRKMLGIRTIFNLLGPLSNPAGAKRQVLGVFSDEWVEPMAQVLLRLGAERALVVHGEDGLDELSISTATKVAEVTPNGVKTYRIAPTDVGLQLHAIEAIHGGAPSDNAAAIKSILEGQKNAFRDIVLFNAGAALYVAEAAPNIAHGIKMCAEAINSGAAKRTLEKLVETSNRTA